MEKLSELLQDGERIEFAYEIDEMQTITFKTFVTKVVDEKIFIIDSPLFRGRYFALNSGEIITMNYVLKDNSSMYTFPVQVLDRVKMGSRYGVMVQLAGEIKKAQRRHYYRMNYIKEINLLVDKDSVPSSFSQSKQVLDGNEWYIVKALTKNLSAGGLKILTRVRVPSEAIVALHLELGEDTIAVTGSVVRSISSGNTVYPYDIGVKFIQMDNITQKMIVAHIFEVQRSMRKRGLI